jgi:hypothetical protein
LQKKIEALDDKMESQKR